MLIARKASLLILINLETRVTSTHRQWFSVVCNSRQRYPSAQWSNCWGLTRLRLMSSNIFSTVLTNIVVDKSTDYAIHCQYFYHSVDVKIFESFILSALRDTLRRAAIFVLLSTTARPTITANCGKHFCRREILVIWSSRANKRFICQIWFSWLVTRKIKPEVLPEWF